MVFNPDSNWLNIKDFRRARIPADYASCLKRYFLMAIAHSRTFERFDPAEIEFSIFRHTEGDIEKKNIHQSRAIAAKDMVNDTTASSIFHKLSREHDCDMVFHVKAGTTEAIAKVSQTPNAGEYVCSRNLGLEDVGPLVYEFVANSRHAPLDAPPLIIEQYLPEDRWLHLYRVGREIGRSHGPFSRRLGEILGTLHRLGMSYGDLIEQHILYRRGSKAELKMIDFGAVSHISTRDDMTLAERDFAHGVLVVARTPLLAEFVGRYHSYYERARHRPIQDKDLAVITRDLIIYAENQAKVTNLKRKLESWVEDVEERL